METELKFALGPQAAEDLRREVFAGRETRDIRSVYYDTANWALRAQGLSLRVREADGESLQGLKGLNGAARLEREVSLTGGGLDRDALAGTPAAEILAEAEAAPVFETRVRRTVSRLKAGRAEIELALDEGEFVAGGRVAPILELEMELKAGSPAALFSEAERWRARRGLSVLTRSKAERGYALAAGEGLKGGEKPGATDLAPGTAAREAFRSMALRFLTAFETNLRHVQAGDSLEAVHQARVALRRLRALMQAFQGVADDTQRPDLEAALRALAGRFGEARDLDVFVAETFRPFAPHEPGAAAFGRLLLAAQSRSRTALREGLQAGEADALLLAMLRWLTVGAWVEAAGPGEGDRAIDDLAPALLHKAWKRFRKAGKSLDWKDADARHGLRIKAKKLRYLADALQSVAPPPKGFDKALRDFQDAAGRLNDLHVARGIARRALGEAPPEDAVFAAGEIVGAARGGEKKLIGKARKAYSQVLDCGLLG